MAISLPWLFLLGLLLPVALVAPLVIEHARGRDKGPREVPTTTLDLERKRTRTKGSKRSNKDPEAMPGLTRVPVDLEILEGMEMEGNVVTYGTLTLGKGASLKGSAKALKGIRLEEESKAYGNLICKGDVELGRLSYVQGVVYTSGNVTLKAGAAVRGIYADGRVDIYPGAEILEDVLAKGGIHLVVPVDSAKALEELESLNALLHPEEFAEDEK